MSFSVLAPARPLGHLHPPATSLGVDAFEGNEPDIAAMGQGDMVLELADGLALAGHSFGAQKSVAGECVFQTG
jgi:carbamoyl-phosphate synthase / aspartate carbamoyltransferase